MDTFTALRVSHLNPLSIAGDDDSDELVPLKLKETKRFKDRKVIGMEIGGQMVLLLTVTKDSVAAQQPSAAAAAQKKGTTKASAKGSPKATGKGTAKALADGAPEPAPVDTEMEAESS